MNILKKAKIDWINLFLVALGMFVTTTISGPEAFWVAGLLLGLFVGGIVDFKKQGSLLGSTVTAVLGMLLAAFAGAIIRRDEGVALIYRTYASGASIGFAIGMLPVIVKAIVWRFVFERRAGNPKNMPFVA
ncbi:MAG TPA: hypothetical protein VFT82_01780 [Candidatus Paceibacterota bacterium]|nr:hypothetical protein [Candidatus Paceibacterota bacterium]